MLTGQQVADKWSRRMKASGADMRTGVEGVTTAPGVKAATKADKMLAGIQEAIRSGKWQKAVSSVSLEDWKKAMIDKGINRVSAGVDASMQKTTQKFDALMSAIGSLKPTIDKMPDTTFEDRVAKMVAWSQGMHKVKLS